MKIRVSEAKELRNHNSYLRKLIIIVILFIQMLTQTSCVGNRKEIQKLYLVVALGIDFYHDGKYEVTMQVLNPAASSTQTSDPGSTSGARNEILIYSGIGESFFDAIFQASKTMGKVQHFGHLKYIVMGETVTASEEKTLLDSLFRLEEIRLNTPLLITKGRASEIVSARTSEDSIPANVVESLLERQEIVGYRPFTYLIDVMDALVSKPSSLIIGVIELVKPTDKLGSETFKLAGSAVFKQRKLVGYLNDKETRGLNWIRGRVEVGSMTVHCPNVGKVSLEILRSSSKIKPILKDHSVSLDIIIKTSSNIKGIDTPVDLVKQPELMDEIGRAENKAIEEEVNLALMAARDNFGADIFQFGEQIRNYHPKEWAAMENDWDTVYKNIDINIFVESKVRGTGSILKSLPRR
jgi:spore germination protein KC